MRASVPPGSGPSWGRRFAAFALLLLALIGATACGLAQREVVDVQTRLAARGARRAKADLESLLARAHAAAAAVPDLAALPRAARFEALERVRSAHEVDGLIWEDPGGEAAWAGRVVEPRPPVSDGPWAGSFAVREVAVHLGPGVRALVVGPLPVSIGHLRVTLLLEAVAHPGADVPFAQRWLEPLAVAAVLLEPPDAPPHATEGSVWAREVVVSPRDGAPRLAVSARSLGLDATGDRIAARTARRQAYIALAVLGALLVTATLLLARRVPPGRPRALAGAALVLLARVGLSAIDLPRSLPELAGAFAPTDFGIEDPLGWLASPGDLALTAGAFLVVVVLLLRAFGGAPAVRRARVAPAAWGIALTLGATLLWVEAVALAVAQGRTPFFQSRSFLPPWPTTLMLLALVAATAGVVLLATQGLRWFASALPSLRPGLARLVGALAVSVIAFALAAERHAPWALALLPAVALLAPRERPAGAEARSAGRVLLLGVLATALLFPLLWSHVQERRHHRLGALLERLSGQPAQSAADARLDLDEIARSPEVVRALEASRSGPRPEGLALGIWRSTSLSRPEQHGLVSVLDADGRLLDEFSLDATPRKRLPTPVPPTNGADLQVLGVRGDALVLGAAVGRATVRGAAGGDGAPSPVLGHVVLTLPDAPAMLLAGLPVAMLEGEEDSLAQGRRPLEAALLQQGRVTASNAATVSREPGGFGPEGLGRLGPRDAPTTWRADGYEGAALWQPERGAVFALRRRTADLEDGVLALARLVVVGVGTALVLSCLVFLLSLSGFRVRLHHRILVSYFVISIIPLVLLAWASAGETRARHERAFSDRLETDLARARGELEAHEARVFDVVTDEALRRAAFERRHDVILFRAGRVSASSRAGTIEAELRSDRLAAEAYRATMLERRSIVRRETDAEGRAVWTGHAPVLAPDGHALASVAVPLLYERDRIDEELTVTGSVVLAGYLLTLVLVLAVGIAAARWIARPLEQLARGTAQVARGDLAVVLPGEGPDEMGRLVTDFNAMTRDLKAARETAAQAEREEAWRRMARQVAHEIKNPLSPMKLMVQQMEADIRRDPARASEAVQRTAGVLLRQIDALARIAVTFGDLARLPPRHLVPVDVGALVQHVVDLNAGARAHDVVVTGRVAADLPRVTADEEELRRVLVNLVNNAVQAIPGAGRVEVRAHAAAGVDGRPGVAVEVEDTGQGIAAEHRALLFEPTFSTKTSGTGLGLAIVKRIVDDLGGTITVDSRPGAGSTFRVWCPLLPRAG
jgi:signal transduction histidine kinase